MKIYHSFTGEPQWAMSKNEFSDSECSKLNPGISGSVENCKAFCLEQKDPRCTAFNYDSSSKNCVLLGCKLPVVPPAKNVAPTYDGYWHAPPGGYWEGIELSFLVRLIEQLTDRLTCP